ncbi:MAG: TRAP transporter substrate-binding protein [Rhodospirillales bacterium]|jgi:TRAP-type C4-dicarboxylate transport system substrate-binding protein
MPIVAVLLALVLSAVSAGAETPRLAHQFPPDSLPGRGATMFAGMVAARGGPGGDIAVYGGGMLGDERANLRDLASGRLQFALTGDLVIAYMAPRFRAVSVPFALDGPDHALAVFDGPLGRKLADHLRRERGIVLLAAHYAGTRMLTTNRPVRSIADLKGLRIRLPPDDTWMAAWRLAGADPRVVAFPDLEAALRRGHVEAQENPPNLTRAAGLHRHQRYLVATDHVPQMQFWFASAAHWDAWPQAVRNALRTAAGEAAAWVTEEARRGQAADVAWLTGEGGMVLLQPDVSGMREAMTGLDTDAGSGVDALVRGWIRDARR